ncbi:Pre-mRNA-processing ATP-dependent RNA helicase PRP5 [Tritrichomonas foetus]|uniref:RNA helicase n=1 Tax=Tritrichomonas foetus TaxID=1144522 RepID=A0A1J4JVK5_9EUKA|nr:Pre-mRNA-processing ATP-dependent RNA helicase PRP5 [Tritrichomonas foetus]|eukprot:OHT02472.1 Pre-mRNA-processing ATP-dependent RNA helicase PRP5 [Tritrichomonas foetus]
MSQSNNPDDDIDALDSFFQEISEKPIEKSSIQVINETSDEDEIDDTAEPYFTPALPQPKRYDENTLENRLNNSNYSNLPLKKNIYIQSQELEKLSPEEVDELREKLGNISVHGINVCCPIENWGQCGLPSQVMNLINYLNFKKPTAIQCQSIPCILSGRDVIGCAITGSGKTLAFVLPAILHILAQPALHLNEAICVFLSPTRELAIQTHIETSRFLKLLDMRSTCLVGGNDVEHQLKTLKTGVHVIVGTPGRFIDLMTTNKNFNLGRVGFLCIDEADRMFDLGFEPQVMKIANALRKDRQTVMFSATFPHIVERAARKLLSNPVEIVVGIRNTVSPNIDQTVEVIKPENKFNRLLQLLGQFQDVGQSLVFTNTQEKAEELFGQLVKRGYKVAMLHAGMDQNDRASILHDFRNGDYLVLVLTSVGSRGIDIMAISLVINYDAPDHTADYVHRLGRTGRAGNKGWAYTFVEPHEKTNAFEVYMALKKSKAKIPPELEEICKAAQPKRKLSGFLGHGFRFDKNESNKIQEERKQVAATEAKKDENKGDDDESDDDEDEDGTTVAAVNDMSTIKTTKDGTFITEFVINDYSAHVRLILTKKETIDTVTDISGTTIIQRGIYCPPGAKPPTGEKKLYFFIEGNSVLAVESAISQLQRMARESDSLKTAPTTKYKVV